MISYNNSKHHKHSVKNYFELFKLLVSSVIDLFSSFICLKSFIHRDNTEVSPKIPGLLAQNSYQMISKLITLIEISTEQQPTAILILNKISNFTDAAEKAKEDPIIAKQFKRWTIIVWCFIRFQDLLTASLKAELFILTKSFYIKQGEFKDIPRQYSHHLLKQNIVIWGTGEITYSYWIYTV